MLSKSYSNQSVIPLKLGKYSEIINDKRLSLHDRIAFVCTFVDDKIALDWLNTLIKESKNTGHLEGLILTGLSKDGMEILQKYIDTQNDIQSVALIVGRMLEPPSNYSNTITNTNTNISTTTKETKETKEKENSITKEMMWLNEYRTLLNRWQLFFERAKLDVELGKCYRNQQSLNNDIKNTSNNSTNKPLNKANIKSNSNLKTDKKIIRSMYTLPPNQDTPHIFLRCHYCSAALPTDPMQQNQSTLTLLRKQKPVLNCCPNCADISEYISMFFRLSSFILGPLQIGFFIINELKYGFVIILSIVKGIFTISDLKNGNF
jgi:hypothetical protein